MFPHKSSKCQGKNQWFKKKHRFVLMSFVLSTTLFHTFSRKYKLFFILYEIFFYYTVTGDPETQPCQKIIPFICFLTLSPNMDPFFSNL